MPKIVHLQKPQKKQSVLRFLGSKAFQDRLGMARKTGNRHLKSSKTFKKGIKKRNNFLNIFLPILGPFFGPKMGPKWGPKLPTHIDPGHPGHVFLMAGVVRWQHKAYFCWQAWYFMNMRKMRGQDGPKKAQDGLKMVGDG